ncbi:MAG: hypothetical protein ACFE9Z_07835 [Promethearchaeota archaeon]
MESAYSSIFGEERWKKFFRTFKNAYSEFPDDILATTPISIELYIALADELVKEYHNGDQRILWDFGEQAAQKALSEGGMFNVFLRNIRNPENFIKFFQARIWNQYYDEGRIEFELEENILHVRLLDLQLHHIYFELTIMGYVKKTLQLVGLTVKETTKIASSKKEIYYQFLLDF